MIQNLNRIKCHEYKFSFGQKCYDVANVFYSIDRGKLDNWIQTTVGDSKNFHKNVVDQIANNSVSIVNGSNGSLLLSPDPGVPPGLCNATTMFNSV